MNVVHDASVLVSGTLSFARAESLPGEILCRWRGGRFDVVMSNHIAGEYERAFDRPWLRDRVDQDNLRLVRALIQGEATWIEITMDVHGVASHPQDDLVLATGLSGKADYLVTGDRDLLGLKRYRTVAIVDPRTFIAMLDAEDARR